MRTVLVSIKPKFAAKIFSGEKTVELRRTRPKVVPGDQMLIYVSAPSMELQGIATIAEVIEAPPEILWSNVEMRSGITRSDYRRYFVGATTAFGIVLTRVSRLAVPRSLAQMRDEYPGFNPPQIYLYLGSPETALWCNQSNSHRVAA